MSLLQRISDHKVLSALTIAGLTALGGTLWQAVTPVLVTFASMPGNQVKMMEALTDLRARVDLMTSDAPGVIYQDAVRVIPEVGSAPRRVRLTYTAWRRQECVEPKIHDRYYSIDHNSFDSGLSGERPLEPLSPTDRFVPFSEWLTLPATIEAGDWAFVPVVLCRDMPPTPRPPAYFRVVRNAASDGEIQIESLDKRL